MKSLGKTKPGIIAVADDYGLGATKGIQASLSKLNITPVATTSYAPSDKDMSTQLLEIKDKGADSLILFGRPADVALVLKQMSELGIKLTTIGNASMVAQTTLNNLSAAEADGAYAIGGMIPQTSTDPKIVDRKLFNRVQQQLADNAIDRKTRRSESGALLMGKLFDERGNAMSPSFSSKNGVRYKFYVSSALLRGRKLEAGSVARVSATNIEQSTINALRERLKIDKALLDADVIGTYVARADLNGRAIKISTTSTARIRSNEFSVPWQPRQPGLASIIESNAAREPDQKLVQTVVRSHAWLCDLQNRKFDSAEALAASVKLHPKVVRQELRYAFLAPAITEAILTGDRPPALSLARIPKTLPLAWSEQCRSLGFCGT